MARLLVPDRLVWIFHKLLIYWDFDTHKQPFLGLNFVIIKDMVRNNTVDPSFNSYFQQMCHVTKDQIVSNWFLEHENEFTTLIRAPKSPDPNPTEHVWDTVEQKTRIMDVQATNLQQMHDAFMSLWTKISLECLSNLLNLCHGALRQFWRLKKVQARCT